MNVGDYVRTKYGITQYREYDTTNGNKILCMPLKDGSNGIFANIEDIIKSSPNIIDLIEVGDLIRGKDNHIFEVYAVGSDCVYISNLKEFILIDDIKSIVTKEQFEQMEYKL